MDDVVTKRAGKGFMDVYRNDKHIGQLWKNAGRWVAVPLREVSHAYPVGIGSAKTAKAALQFFM